MLTFKSFIDVLFILLLGSIVMLSQSVQVGAVDTAPARVGGGAVSAISADDVRVVVVSETELILDEQTWPDAGALAGRIEPGETALLVTASADVRHHRIMAVWSALRERGVDVKLGVEPDAGEEKD